MRAPKPNHIGILSAAWQALEYRNEQARERLIGVVGEGAERGNLEDSHAVGNGRYL